MEVSNSFWDKLPKHFLGLAPMDGVTDFLFRDIYADFGVDLMFTEFTAVEGIAHNALKLLKDFKYTEKMRPIVAQVFGIDPESFYIAAIIVSELGFDGIDINMGCPAKNVERRGAGAGLIRNPKLAKEIIRSVRLGVIDYFKGKRVTDLKMKNKMKEEILEMAEINKRELIKPLPVSVKTRIGYDKEEVESWIPHILEEELSAITIHGRTLKQMYSGEADYEAILKAVKLVRKTNTKIIGNGDVKSRLEAQEKCLKYDLDGILVGRASFGNPWLFNGKEPTLKEKIDFVNLHAKRFEETFGADLFYAMRKHLGWYIKSIPHAKEIRKELMLSNNSAEVMAILKKIDS